MEAASKETQRTDEAAGRSRDSSPTAAPLERQRGCEIGAGRMTTSPTPSNLRPRVWSIRPHPYFSSSASISLFDGAFGPSSMPLASLRPWIASKNSVMVAPQNSVGRQPRPPRASRSQSRQGNGASCSIWPPRRRLPRFPHHHRSDGREQSGMLPCSLQGALASAP